MSGWKVMLISKHDIDDKKELYSPASTLSLSGAIGVWGSMGAVTRVDTELN
jgi:hypothetical protein